MSTDLTAKAEEEVRLVKHEAAREAANAIGLGYKLHRVRRQRGTPKQVGKHGSGQGPRRPASIKTLPSSERAVRAFVF